MSFVKGLAKLNRQFEAIEKKIITKSMRSVLNRAGTPILKAARAEAPKLRGHLRKALAKRYWVNPSKSIAGVAIGVKDNYRVPNPAWTAGSKQPKTFFPKNYLHLVIFGTAEHKAPDGATIHAATPNDFLTRAREQTEGEARRIIEFGLKDAVKAAALSVGGPR